MTIKTILTCMGGYYLLTALWPIFHMKSFEAVTGKKTDHWLVKTVSVMILGSAVVFLLPWWLERDVTLEMRVLAIMNAAGLTVIDVYYSLRGRIRKIYLADAACELVFLALLLTK